MMGPEALWSLNFTSSTDKSGGGIAVLYRNRVMGGNSSFTYRGTYRIKNDDIHFEVEIKRFNDSVPGFYKDEFILIAQGKYDDLEIDVVGYPEDEPDISVHVKLHRQGEIP